MSVFSCIFSMASTIFFSGPSHPLSNLYPFSFIWKGHRFNSVEAAYQWEKACHHGLRLEAEEILHCPDPTFKVMYLGRALPSSPSWEQCRLDCMFALLQQKFHHCFDYRLALRGGDCFVEDTFHPFWGFGRHGTGFNWLGQLHLDIKRQGRSICILGSSHAQGMAPILRKFLQGKGVYHVDERPLGGATIDRVRHWIDSNDIGMYDYMILVIGSNDFYSKKGIPLARGLAVCHHLTDLYNHVSNVSPSLCLLKHEIIPRCSINSGNLAKIFKDQCQETRFCNNMGDFDIKVPKLWKSRKSGNPIYFSKDCVHLNMKGKHEIAKAWSLAL